jgi:SecD/SecF fusion protein
MLHFARWKIAAILAVCLAGLLVSLPNLVPASALPSWLQQTRISLGLDLRGGSYLLLEVDTDSVVRERLEALVDGARTGLRAANVGYLNLASDPANRRISLRLRDMAQAEAALRAVRELANPVPLGGLGGTAPDIEVSLAPDGLLTATLTEASLRAKATNAVEQSIEIVRRRIDETGVVEPLIARQGQNRILVQLPGVEDPNRIKELIGRTARMTFHLLDETAIPGAGPAPPGVMFLRPENPRPGDPEVYAVRRRVEVEGANLTDARAAQDSRTGEWVVNFTFDSTGARRFAEITRNNVGRPFAIVLDERVLTAPVIREPITGGRGQISGNFTVRSANDLAVLLRAGALPAPLTVVEERTVGPELGADAIRAGMLALAAGTLFVFLYMGFAYGLFGWFACAALVVNVVLIAAALSLLGATLTLPGIAGIVLILGTAVDANILINERIREEIKAGRTPANAIETGYRRATGTIVDSNLTNLIAMAMLYAFGSGPVRGFAVTVAIGTIIQMWTATVLVRLMIAFWYRGRRPKELPVLEKPGASLMQRLARPLFRVFPDNTRIPFMKGARIGLVTSAVISSLSLAALVWPGLSKGIDFQGGIIMEVRTEQPADLARLRGAIGGLGLGEAGLQQFGDANTVLVRLPVQADEAGTQRAVSAVRAALEEASPGARMLRVEAVGSRVSDELFQGGMIALGISFLMMLIYIWFRFEWQFAIGAVATLLLDTTKVIGFLVVTGIEFNLTTVAAVLTIIGFNANDKVVVFDRVRENLRKYKQMPLRELVDLSINETMNRTIGTSATLLLAALPLALFGGPTLSGFAWTLIFGVVVGTSSSIFIASPIVLYTGGRKLRPAGDGAAVPAAAR